MYSSKTYLLVNWWDGEKHGEEGSLGPTYAMDVAWRGARCINTHQMASIVWIRLQKNAVDLYNRLRQGLNNGERRGDLGHPRTEHVQEEDGEFVLEGQVVCTPVWATGEDLSAVRRESCSMTQPSN